MIQIRTGQSVTLSCSSFLEDGTCLDEGQSSDPIVLGAGVRSRNRFSTAISAALVGMRANETKQIKIPGSVIFGEFDPKKIYKLNLSKDRSMQVGDELQVKVTTNGRNEILDGTIVKFDGDYTHVDTNHPLAGEKIILKIKIVSFK